MSTDVDTIAAATQARLQEWAKVEQMSNGALSEAFHERVWGVLPPQSYEDLLATELLSRFERLAGVERKEDGDVVRPEPTQEDDLVESLVYLGQAVEVAEECGEDTVRVKVDRVKDVVGVVRSPRIGWEV